jgi:hypothetical protein
VRTAPLNGRCTGTRRDSILDGVRFTARTSLPHLDEARAVSGLRTELREQAAAHWQVADWSTLEVTGPVEVIGASGRTWYRWTATVEAEQAARRTG